MWPKRLWKTTAAVLVATLFLTTAGLTIVEAQGATSAQLQTMIQAAQASRSYASGLAAKAASNGLNVASEQALLASGDALFAQAQADLSSSSNLAAGIQDAQGAMQDYTGAAVGSSLVLKNAGLTASVDLAAVADAEVEVNTTATLVAGLAAQACGSISVNPANLGVFQASCAEARSGIANATLDLMEVASLMAQGGVGASANINATQAFAILAQAREDVNASASELVTISSFTYYQRGQTYYNQTLLPLYAAANASIGAQQTASANLSGIQGSFRANVQALARLAAAFSTLQLAVEQPVTLTLNVSSSAAASESTVAEVRSNLTSLLGIATGLVGSGPLLSAIGSAQTDASAYSNSVDAANSTSSGYASASIPVFSTYLTGLNTDKQSVQTAGQTFVSDCTNVLVQLRALINALGILAPPGLLAANSTLTTLKGRVSSNADSLNLVLSTETGAMSSFQSAVNATIAASGANSGVLVGASTVQAMATLAQKETSYLNSTSLAAIESAASSIPSQANSTADFIKSLNASLSGTVTQFIASINVLATTGASVGQGANVTASAFANAATAVGADVTARTSALAAAQAEVASAFTMFSNNQVSDGVSAMLAAGVDFGAAAATYS